MSEPAPFRPTPRQIEAIESGLGPLLVLAGPGAGKTLCLIERIRFLIEHRGIEPARICALTYTNKAAEEVASRLTRHLGERGAAVTRSTIHSLCVKVLRAEGRAIGIERGFGIADDDYQKEVLVKHRCSPRWAGGTLTRFSRHRLTGWELTEEDQLQFRRYRDYLTKRGMLDFDDLVIQTRRLFDEHPEVARRVAGQWDYLLVDEFQDLNPVQYAVVKTLAAPHRNVFAVGDDEQSIFAFAGADPKVIVAFINDFKITGTIVLDENWRTARLIFELARRFISANPNLFGAKDVVARRDSAFPVEAKSFPDEIAETRWILGELGRDRAASGLSWGDYAVLYRKHTIGDHLEGELMRAGIPCRPAHGRAVADDRVVAYLVAAMKVIAWQGDPVINESFSRAVLPASVADAVRRQAESEQMGFMPALRKRSRELGFTDEDGKKIRRALASLQNLAALSVKHATLPGLVDEILSQRVGTYQTALEQRAEDLSDPALDPAVVRLAGELANVKMRKGRILFPLMGGLEIGLAGLYTAGGFRLVDYLKPGDVPAATDLVIEPARSGLLGIALTSFKALQLANVAAGPDFKDFVVVDLETTGREIGSAEIVEIAAVRVRDWEIVAEFHRLVKPRVPIEPEASAVHGYRAADVETAAHFEAVWPEFRAFAGTDTLVAHNGYQFDFPILGRMIKSLGDEPPGAPGGFVTFDTLPLARALRIGSAKLEHLAEKFGVDKGTPHQALWDVRTLAKVYRKLEEERRARTRRTALSGALDHLGVALALSDPDTLTSEGVMLADLARIYALGRYSNSLDYYRAERGRVGPTAATIETLIDRLGGVDLMARVRAEKRAEDRYPNAMARIRRLIEGLEELPLADGIVEFLGRLALSRSDGVEADPNRVNLLTLHSTKGLEFSRVFIVGVEDSEFPGGSQTRTPTKDDVEEARRLLYVGMTRAKDRLVMTRVDAREGRLTGGRRFLEELGLENRPGPGVHAPVDA